MTDERIGRYAVCDRGVIGKVTRYWGGGIWFGRDLEGRRWQTSKPRWLHPAEEARMAALEAAIFQRRADEVAALVVSPLPIAVA